MLRKVAFLAVLTSVLVIDMASAALLLRTVPLNILPEDCQLGVNEKLALTLDGSVPRDVVVSWDVDEGGIASVLPGREAVLVAPSMPTVITVSVTLSPPISGAPASITRQCIVALADD